MSNTRKIEFVETQIISFLFLSRCYLPRRVYDTLIDFVTIDRELDERKIKL